MRTACLALGLSMSLVADDPGLDCQRPAEALVHIGRLRLAELEYAEDVHREVHWAALGRCGTGAGSDACREAETRRFDAMWQTRREAIDARFRRMREAYEERC